MPIEHRSFPIKDVFDIKPGKRLVAADSTPGDRPFIGALDNSNGVARFVDDVNESLDSNVLGVNYNGNGMVIGFYHPYECIFTDDVKRFHLKDTKDGRDVLLYAKVPILMQKSKFGYLYKFNAQRMEKTRIMLPVDDSGDPDWEYMDEYSASTRARLLEKYKQYVAKRVSGLEYREVPGLDEIEWDTFAFADVFDIKKGFYNKKPRAEVNGDIPFLGATAKNNGVTEWYTFENIERSSKTGGEPNESIERKIFGGGAVAVTNNGSVGHAYYWPSRFTCSHDINPLYRADGELITAPLAMFLIGVIEKQAICFEYARKWRPERMVKSRLMLPVASDGKPDYAYMEQYGMNMMKRKYEQYLAYLDGQGE